MTGIIGFALLAVLAVAVRLIGLSLRRPPAVTGEAAGAGAFARTANRWVLGHHIVAAAVLLTTVLAFVLPADALGVRPPSEFYGGTLGHLQVLGPLALVVLLPLTALLRVLVRPGRRRGSQISALAVTWALTIAVLLGTVGILAR